jgi:hypothetical protein
VELFVIASFLYSKEIKKMLLNKNVADSDILMFEDREGVIEHGENKYHYTGV